MLQARLRLLVAVLWAGSLWTVGYLVAPVLFATLDDRVLAGTIAGSMFHYQACLVRGCFLVLGLMVLLSRQLAVRDKRRLFILMGAMFVCALLVDLVLRPYMAELRAAAGPAGVLAGAARTQFGVLHGVSSGIFLVQSVMAGFLLVWIGEVKPISAG